MLTKHIKVIHINTSDYGAGAPNAVSRLNEALNLISCDSIVWVEKRKTYNKKVFSPDSFLFKKKNYVKIHLSLLFAKLLNSTNKILHSPQIFSSRYWVDSINKSNADIIHLHWFQHEMLSISDINKIDKPIVWTFHDMWPFCGAEHVSYDNRFIEGYNKKNRPKHEKGFDLNKWTWKRKLKNWKKPLEIITPSKWMKQNVKNSYLMSKWPVTIIPNTIDVNIWKPINIKSARTNLSLPQNMRLILFGSASGTDGYHKGYDLLKKTLIKLGHSYKKKDIGILIFGEKNQIETNINNIPIFNLGYLRKTESLVNAYSSADVVVVPSRIDNYPNIVLEANSCGSPVVAFNSSGLPSIIRHKYNGYLAKPFETDDLLKGILWILKNQETNNLRKNSRQFIIKNCNYEKIAKHHQELYEKILKKYD